MLPAEPGVLLPHAVQVHVLHHWEAQRRQALSKVPGTHLAVGGDGPDHGHQETVAVKIRLRRINAREVLNVYVANLMLVVLV